MAQGPELGKAYVQIIPSAKGIGAQLRSAFGNTPTQVGQSVGGQLAGAVKTAIAAAGIGAAFSKALSEGAALEQSLGGVETLFKDSADQVIANAEKAFQTAGVSANSYMEQVTSFSATLLQGLGGDTDAAARIADQAIVQMADNANKMGTDMASIQYAYQGFAKDNYEMLDNLKLGYGGTQSEMARLINDSGVLGDSIQVTAETVKDVPFDKIIEAIGVIQDDLGITGTTAEEAATTLSGSLASMKASFSNVLSGLTLGRDIGPALNGLAQTTTTFLVGNLLPAIGNILSALPGAVVTFIQAAVPQFTSALLELFPQLESGILSNLPQIANTARLTIVTFTAQLASSAPAIIAQGGALLTQLAAGLSQALPELLLAATVVIGQFLQVFVTNAPLYLNMGAQILGSMIGGIGQKLPEMLEVAARIVLNLITGLIQNLPQILAAGFELVTTIITGIGNALPGVIQAAGLVAQMILNTIREVDWMQLGKDIIQGMIDGIGAMAGALWEAATNIARSAMDAIKSFFGIASPSKLMRDEVGRWIPAGIAEGLEKGKTPLVRAMNDLAASTAQDLQTILSMNSRQHRQAYAQGPGPDQSAPAFRQYVYFEQPMQAPDEIARALRIQNTYGLAGAR